MSRRRVLTVALAVGLAGCGAAVIWTGHTLTRAARVSTGLASSDLAVRAIAFPSASQATLSAWFIQGEPRAGAVLLLHGVRSNKSSMLGRARFLKALGFSVLMVDLQAHGESSGERITFGYREARDVEAATLRLMELAPGERIGVFGTSLGAAATALSAAKPHYAAVVLESLYPTIEEAVAQRLRLRLGSAGAWLSPLLLMQLESRLDVRPDQLRPIDRVGEFACPVLVVHGSEDSHTTLAQARRLFGAIRAPKAMYVVEGAAHVDLHAHAQPEYEQRIGTFFVSHLRALPAASTLFSRLE